MLQLSVDINALHFRTRPVAQSVARPIVDPGVVSLILARAHTFVEIDYEIFSAVILHLPLILEGFVVRYKQKYVHEVLVNPLVKLAQENV